MSQDAPTTDHTLETSAGPPDAPPVAVPSVGDLVGPYRITSLAGAGGMGVVFRARDEQLDRAVALKLIAPEYARDPRFREMFLRESRAAASIEHPNVIPVYRADQDGDRLYIAMRLVDGESLSDLIAARGKLPPAQAARILGQVAAALEAAHRRGLLHRDVKPANILVSGDDDQGVVYLSDFGLATRFVEDAAGGRWAGTLAYLAPEQIRGGTLDARTDVYALGCVLFQSLTGRVPFPTRDERAAQVAHLTQAPPRVSEIVPGVPAGFDAVVARAMAKRPEDRFASAAAFAAALAALRFDAVLVHHPDDRPAADTLRAALRAEGLEVWAPAEGADDLPEALRASAACIVLVGPAGLGDWARDPLALAQELALRDRAFRLSAALLPGAPDPFGPGMGFLAGRAWADLRLGTGDRDGRRELLRLVRDDPPPAARDAGPEVNPYRGLASFGEDDAGFFVGREDEVAQLVERLRGRRFLAVVGPSGSGKSSLVAAGLVPAVHRDAAAAWRVATLSPGSRPLAALAGAVTRLVPPSSDRPGAGALGTDPAALRRSLEGALPDGDGHRVLLVVDQFEEAFTLAEPDERAAFVDALADAATLPGGRIWVVAAMRADFYPRCADHPVLRDLVAANQFLVGPMSPAALRRAIEVPARRAGLSLEPGLTRRILGDLAGRPGALPLLQHLLLELWHRRRGRELTLEAYAASGGVEGAVARRAEEVVNGLTPAQRDVARQVLLRLTQPGEGTEDTRRRAEMRELALTPDQHTDVDAVVGAFTAARLFTTGRDAATGQPTVEVAHEALIRSWPRLRGWLDEEREDLRIQHRLAQAAADWERGGWDAGQLYRGARLAAWRERGTGGLNDRERAFLDASQADADLQARARRRRTRAVMAGLATALVAVGAAGGFALLQRNDAQGQRDIARSRQLAAESVTQLAADPELAVLLARRALDAERTPAAVSALRSAVAASRVRAALSTHTAPVTALAVLPSGRVISLDAGGSLSGWSPGSPAAPGTAPGTSTTRTVALGPRGRWLVAGSDDGRFSLLDPERLEVVRRFGRPGAPVRAVTAASGTDLITAWRADGSAEVWDSASGRLVRILGTVPGQEGGGTALTPDGSTAVVASQGGLSAWDVASGKPVRLPTLPGLEYGAAATSPDGARVIVGALTDAYVITLGGGRPVRLVGHPTRVNAVAFAPDGAAVATGGLDGTVRVWNAATGSPLAVLRGHDGPVRSVAFTPDGREVVSGADDRTVRVWDWTTAQPKQVAVPGAMGIAAGGLGFRDGDVVLDAPDGAVLRWTPGGRPVLTPVSPGGAPGSASVAATSRAGARVTAGGDGNVAAAGPAGTRRIPNAHEGPVMAVATSDDGSVFASLGAFAPFGDGTLRLWRPQGPPSVVRGATVLRAIALSPDGALVAAGDENGAITIRPVADPAQTTRLVGHTGHITSLAFAPDGSRLVSSAADGTLRLWATADGSLIQVLRGHAGNTARAVFDAAGTVIVSGGDDGLRVWDAHSGAAILAVPGPSMAEAAVSPDGAWLAGFDVSGSGGDYRILAYRCEVCGPEAQVERLAGERITRDLTPDEQRTLGVD